MAHLVLHLEVGRERDDVVAEHLVALRDALRLRRGIPRSREKADETQAVLRVRSRQHARPLITGYARVNQAGRSRGRTSCTGARKWFLGLRFTFRTSGLLGRPGGTRKNSKGCPEGSDKRIGALAMRASRDALNADSAARWGCPLRSRFCDTQRAASQFPGVSFQDGELR